MLRWELESDVRMRLSARLLGATGVVLSVFCLGCDGLLGPSDDRVKALEKEVEHLKVQVAGKSDSGRFQIVNPMPTILRNSMLLDTVTGKTWLFCTITDSNGKALDGTEGTGWCEMSQAVGRDSEK
jgi:hypothetical protein